MACNFTKIFCILSFSKTWPGYMIDTSLALHFTCVDLAGTDVSLSGWDLFQQIKFGTRVRVVVSLSNKITYQVK